MNIDEIAVREAADRWRKLRDEQRVARQILKEELSKRLGKYTLVQLSEMTDIKRPTLYYIIWNKKGRHGSDVGV